MPSVVAEYCQTPNPNALKIVLARPLDGGPRSYRTPQDAADDPLANALFAIEGVVGLLLMNSWLTVNKSPDISWPKLKRDIEQTLTDHLA